jgi:uncharacterized protein
MRHFEEILEFANSLAIVDTHEHLPPEAEWARSETNVLRDWLTHYFNRDLVSAGLPQKEMDAIKAGALSAEEIWPRVEPYWNAARDTGYGRCLDIVARDLYGVARVDGESVPQLEASFQARRAAARAGESWYRQVLREKGRIEVSLIDSRLECDRDLFRSVYRIGHFMTPLGPDHIRRAGEKLGMRIHTLADWEDAMRLDLERACEAGIAALKCGCAYQRSLFFEKVSRASAEEAFNEIFKRPAGPDFAPVAHSPSETLQNHMLHRSLAWAEERGLAYQFHTGLQEGNGNLIRNSDPALLSNLFLEYGGLTFDLFHISYPFERTAGALAKNFPNVTLDMCWAHIISPEACVRALVEWLDAVPANKICAFGGDYCFIDGVYGHQKMARRNVARALATKVGDGCFDLERAREICRWLFCDNPRRIFRLDA